MRNFSALLLTAALLAANPALAASVTTGTSSCVNLPNSTTCMDANGKRTSTIAIGNSTYTSSNDLRTGKATTQSSLNFGAPPIANGVGYSGYGGYGGYGGSTPLSNCAGTTAVYSRQPVFVGTR